MSEPPASVHPPVVRAHISHAVIATYVADATLAVPGVAALAERASRSIHVRPAGYGDGVVDLDLGIVLDAGASAPTVCRAVDAGVRAYLASMVAVETDAVSIVVEGVAAASADASL